MEIKVPFVSTHDNIADFFTKPLDPKRFRAFRDRIMNLPPSVHDRAGSALYADGGVLHGGCVPWGKAPAGCEWVSEP